MTMKPMFATIVPRVFKLFARLSLVLFPLTIAHSSAVTWNLNGVTFSDGGVASGYFLYDPASQSVLNWDVVTSASDVTGGGVYIPGTSTAVTATGGCVIDFLAEGNASQYTCLDPVAALIAGTTPALSPDSFESYPGGVRMVVSGDLVDQGPGETVPEPATFGLVALVLLKFIRGPGERLRLS